MAGVTRLELATSCVTASQNRKYAKFNASFYACKQSSNEGAVDTSRQLVVALDQLVDQLLFLTLQLLDCCANHARLDCLQDADHFPSAFNSSPVLPPCLRRRSADLTRDTLLELSHFRW